MFNVKLSEVQPQRHKLPPKFDKDGRPVELLDTCRWDTEGAPSRAERTQVGPKTERRDELAQAVREACFVRQLRQQGNTTRVRKRGRGRV